MAGGQSLDEAQSEGGCQHETPINTLLSCPHLFHLSQSCRAHLIILPTHSRWLKCLQKSTERTCTQALNHIFPTAFLLFCFFAFAFSGVGRGRGGGDGSKKPTLRYSSVFKAEVGIKEPYRA